ncbi:O-antigen ligase family protein [Propionicimonas sp.]|uniref:O-antigen ligase family protein n=1 Tax=Propionicimonas sp. TaxID=1955623 RepID=UPI0039E330F9
MSATDTMTMQTGREPGLQTVHSQPASSQRTELPAWPLAAVYFGFPVWWFLGIVDFIYIPIACIMAVYLIQRRAIFTPPRFGVWLLFLVWVGCSVIGLTAAIQFVGFGYRFANLLAYTVIFLYTFNARKSLNDRTVTGMLTWWWLLIVVGGYIAMAFPTGVFRTPMSYLVPDSLLSNDWVHLMVVRPLNQYNPDSYFKLDPRPSAPFIYTNQWGNAYSLLLPMVIAYLAQIRRDNSRRFWLLLLAIPVSFVPALYTTNRGMFLAVGIAALYVALRLAARRDIRGLLAIAATSVVGLIVFQLLPIQDRLQTRSEATSLVDRAWLYLQSLDAIKDSVLFGYGRTFMADGAVDPVGTQGEFWIVLVSHGVGAVVLFLAWFALAFMRSFHWHDAVGLAANTVLLVALVGFFYYGSVPHALPVIMIAAALVLRSTHPDADDPFGHLSGLEPSIEKGVGRS